LPHAYSCRPAMSVQSRRPMLTVEYTRASRLSQFLRFCMSTLHLHVSSHFAFRGHLHNTVVDVFSFQSYANATEKQPCVFELTTYSEIDVSGTGFLNTVVRDNCETAWLFCDSTTQVCERLRLVGQQCQYHRGCQSVHFSVLYLLIFQC
jgi:hypothetical protein